MGPLRWPSLRWWWQRRRYNVNEFRCADDGPIPRKSTASAHHLYARWQHGQLQQLLTMAAGKVVYVLLSANFWL
jgi:hypothetical protein